ncbi:dTDP-4-dehydrorhamnose 3,5-epimerase [Leptobacterium flavescens]|uniref:dTDP-4-dehydrorhamnose 3,5-epimerase n=1 Tax=Leptobacterium flavescens TaxID=472055 RepID=A0A6P0UN33_9FLAO|nr:dTDP-4-dehydrorhamnose 3,5-epimerase [Leptobacterium flavescens]NER13259.1 dTDP-4-dehydrorhamnose 3,5-epimerase [Leptobacterium flavescens]
MEIEETYIKDCYLIKPTLFVDERGSFFESFNRRQFLKQTGIDVNFVQDNQSISKKGVLRGLHFQKDKSAQSKLVRVIKGKVLDVAVDLRKNSLTFGKHIKTVLSEENNLQLFIPGNFAHGFLALSEDVIFSYKCDNYYDREMESGIKYDDPDLNIDWEYPKEHIILSQKDKDLRTFQDLLL